MRLRSFLAATLLIGLSAGGWAWYREAASPGQAMSAAGVAFLGTLDAQQQAVAVMPYDDQQRTDWHFIPKETRKGLRIKEMNPAQQAAAHSLLKTALSEAGYSKATKIMANEKLLQELEAGKGRWPREFDRYFFTVFGAPAETGRWGLSVEGHHLSLNFVVDNGKVISSTPLAMGTNPATIKTENKGKFELGTRILAREESLAFDLLKSLSDEQKKTVMIAEKAPSEVRAAGEPQPPTEPPAGIAASKLTKEQQQQLRELLEVYTRTVPEPVAKDRWDAIESAGFGNVHFGWAGGDKEGIGHYYRLQGPSFLVEFVNVQPDAAGNPANHIHIVWRDMHGDFALPIGGAN